jgi:hypothetical protein
MVASAAPASAWSPQTARQIALDAASIAPPDLKRQIERHESEFLAGLLEEAEYPSALGMPLDEAIEAAVERSIGLIRTHQPFAEIVRQMGATLYYVAYANNPLIVGQSDPEEGAYFADYLEYVDSARPRFAVVFYGLVPEFESTGRIGDLVAQTLSRGRLYYPMVGGEYERIGGGRGVELFDDRSTAFGVSAVAFSQAVTDAAIVLRHIWIVAGGMDPRGDLPVRESGAEPPAATTAASQ